MVFPKVFHFYESFVSKTKMSVCVQVDVWSAGVLFFQMLFGKRPFGHDQTQERILREDTIIKARKVDFPSRPAVSNEAKVSVSHFLTSAANFLVALLTSLSCYVIVNA